MSHEVCQFQILDPVYPGHEFPLPLHLAETGRIRWRPLGSTYLWSEAYSISNILSSETKIKIKNFRSFVCYPSLPSSDPFRCCISVHGMCLPSIGRINKGSSSLYIHDSLNQSDKMENQDHSNKRCIHLITISSPLIVKNYLPVTVSLMIESGGVTRNVLLSEVGSLLWFRTVVFLHPIVFICIHFNICRLKHVFIILIRPMIFH